jgi:hypothetical protein
MSSSAPLTEPAPSIAESRLSIGHASTIALQPGLPLPALFFFPPTSIGVTSPWVLLIVPGGGFKSYARHEGCITAQHFAACGHRCYVLAYRFKAAGGTVCDCHADMRCALAHLRRHEPGCRIHALGFSAGGCLVAGTCGRHSHDGDAEPEPPDSCGYIYGHVPPGLRLCASPPPFFLYATAADTICEVASCHDAMVRLLLDTGSDRARDLAMLWPDVANGDAVLTAKLSGWCKQHSHGQGIGLHKKGELHLFEWVHDLHGWIGRLLPGRDQAPRSHIATTWVAPTVIAPTPNAPALADPASTAANDANHAAADAPTTPAAAAAEPAADTSTTPVAPRAKALDGTGTVDLSEPVSSSAQINLAELIASCATLRAGEATAAVVVACGHVSARRTHGQRLHLDLVGTPWDPTLTPHGTPPWPTSYAPWGPTLTPHGTPSSGYPRLPQCTHPPRAIRALFSP